MFNNASNVDASHSTFNEVHRDQHVYSRTHVQGDYTINTIVHGNQVFEGASGLEGLRHASVPGAAFDSIDRHPAPSCLPGTRSELLARLADWADSPDCNQPICWLSGLAGSGKSAVAQTVAETYAGQHRLVGSFFFSRKEILRRKAHGFFPTLACQLLAFAPSIKPILLDALNVDVTIPTKVLPEQARKLLQEPIASSPTSFPEPILIVVDSLDECDDAKMADEIVHLLTGILRHCRWPLKILFTSRADPHIVQTFQYPELQNVTRSLQLQDFTVDDDIRAYLYHSFKGIHKSMNDMPIDDPPPPWPSETVIEVIVQKAAGLFIFATTVVKSVAMGYGSPTTQLQAVLQALQDGAIPGSAFVQTPLDMLYLDALRTIPDVEKVRLVLGSVVFAFQPLSARALGDLLRDFQFDASYIIRCLRSVLVVSESDIEDDGAVHIYHTSFRDFLTSPNRSQQYVMDPVVSHNTLACSCLELMLRHLKTDICNLGDPSIMNCEIEDLDKRCRLNIREAVRYACRWFAHHLSQVPWDHITGNTLLQSLQGFATQHLFHWIEVLSLTGQLDSAVFSLREVMDWLKRSQGPYEETLSLFRDAERLVLMTYDSIKQAALQVYYSIPYVPIGTQIRTTYAHELKNKYVITHGVDDRWTFCLRSVSTGATVKSLAISASGRLIASAGDAPGVQLWDAVTGCHAGNFHGNSTSSCPVMFSPSEVCVAVGYETGAIDVWDVTTGQHLLDSTPNLHSASVTGVAFSRNSLLIASASVDATVHLWDISTGTFKHSLAYHKGSLLCLAFSPSDGLIASGSDDTSITTSDVHSGQLVRKFRGHTSKVNSIAFSPDGKTIVSGSDDQSARLWDTRTGVCLRTYDKMHKLPVRQVWITADNKHIVSVCNMNIYMWETTSSHRKSPQHIWSVDHYFKKAMTMFPAWYAKVVKLFPSSLVGRLAETAHGATLYTASSPDGMSIGCAYDTSLLFLECLGPRRGWSRVSHPLTTSSTLQEPPLSVDVVDEDHDDKFTAVAMTADMSLLITSTTYGTIQMWNTSPRSDWKFLYSHLKSTAEGFWLAPDGRSLLVKLVNGLQLVMPTGTLIKNPETGGDGLSATGAVPSPDSRYFAYWAEYAWNVDQSFSIFIYNASTGARLRRIPGFFKITCGRFSAESDLLACAHGDGIVQIWELPSVICKTTIKTEHAAITALEWLPGNSTLVMGSDDGHVEIRSVESGDVVYRTECSQSKILSLAVANEALVVIVGHEDGSIFLWNPSYPSATPHCLLEFKETPDDTVTTPDGVDFIKFTEGCRSICSRSTKGVICTWDLTHCLAEYAERGEEVSVESAVAESVAINVPISEVPNDSTQANSPLPSTQDEPSESDSTIGQTSSEALGLPNTTDPPSSAAQCSHLVSRSDAHIVYDRYFRSTYSVDGREGWVYRGSRRMFWLPADLRPASPEALSAFEDRLAILTRSQVMLCCDLTPMVNAMPALYSGGSDIRPKVGQSDGS